MKAPTITFNGQRHVAELPELLRSSNGSLPINVAAQIVAAADVDVSIAKERL